MGYAYETSKCVMINCKLEGEDVQIQQQFADDEEEHLNERVKLSSIQSADVELKKTNRIRQRRAVGHCRFNAQFYLYFHNRVHSSHTLSIQFPSLSLKCIHSNFIINTKNINAKNSAHLCVFQLNGLSQRNECLRRFVQLKKHGNFL